MEMIYDASHVGSYSPTQTLPGVCNYSMQCPVRSQPVKRAGASQNLAKYPKEISQQKISFQVINIRKAPVFLGGEEEELNGSVTT